MQASISSEARQIASRLKKLLPLRLNDIKKSCLYDSAEGTTVSKAKRQALTDERYLDALDEYLQIYSKSLLARIQWDTHRMLMEARRSLNKSIPVRKKDKRNLMNP